MVAKVIYEGKDIQVLMDYVSDIGVIYSFSGFEAHLSDNPAYGNGFIQKIGFTAVFFISKISHWWQSPELDEAINCANKYTSKFTTRITYGQSMGGYGALLSSGKLKSFFLVTAPQSIISDSTVPLHPVWKDHIERFPLIRDNVLEEVDNSLGGIVIYDPLTNMDKKHFSYISSKKGITGLTVPFGTHYIPKCLSEMGIFSEIMKELIYNKDISVSDIRKKIRTRRFLSPTYVLNITQLVVRRKSSLLKKILYNYFIECLSNEDMNNYDLTHIFEVIVSGVLKLEDKISIKLGSYELVSSNKHTEFFDENSKILKAVGNDPQFIFRLANEMQIKSISIDMYSSVECEAIIYYTHSNEVKVFNSINILRKSVKQGLNKLVFDFSDIYSINSVLRFDPLKQEGVFYIKNMSIT